MYRIRKEKWNQYEILITKHMWKSKIWLLEQKKDTSRYNAFFGAPFIYWVCSFAADQATGQGSKVIWVSGCLLSTPCTRRIITKVTLCKYKRYVSVAIQLEMMLTVCQLYISTFDFMNRKPKGTRPVDLVMTVLACFIETILVYQRKTSRS